MPTDNNMSGQSLLPNSAADDYFLSNAHLAYASFGNPTPVAGPSNSGSSSKLLTSRPRSPSLEESSSDERTSRRRKIDNYPEAEQKEEDVRQAMEFASLDEDEMMKRAIEASLLDHNGTSASTTAPVSDDLSPRHQQRSSSSQAETVNGVHPVEGDEESTGFADDAPTVEDLRALRLARFANR